jgi:hypothetical protein
MEYYRDTENQIRAEFALRVGKLINQYEKSDLLKDKYEATLYIMALQSLLTQCQELYRAMKDADRKKQFLAKQIEEKNEFWGIRNIFIAKDTFYKGLPTYGDFFNHLRNALSHPTDINLEAHFPSTGYTTVPDNSGVIKTLCFIDSPDVKKTDRLKSYSKDRIEKILKDEIKYQFKKDDNPFARIFKIELPIKAMRKMVLSLSNYLAQPSKENWDGQTFDKLIKIA